jgi:hypothetical protein
MSEFPRRVWTRKALEEDRQRFADDAEDEEMSEIFHPSEIFHSATNQEAALAEADRLRRLPRRP